MPKQYHIKKEEKMRKAMQRIKKMTFQSKKRRFIEPITEEDKYLIALMRKPELVEKIQNENISRTTRGAVRPQYI